MNTPPLNRTKCLILLFLSVFWLPTKADRTATLFYRDGTQKKITVPDRITLSLLSVEYDPYISGQLSIFAYSEEGDLSKEEKQAVEKLAREIGDGKVETDKENGSVKYFFEVPDITGMKIN